MFRDITPSKMDPDHFGAGSTIYGCQGDPSWLVVARTAGVTLLNLDTMVVNENIIHAVDINYLSKDETLKLLELTRLAYTFSDFTLETKGMKKIK
jgi:hypothetical protein